MPYTFTAGGDAMKIKEQQYASAAEIGFTKFTSCIGVVALKGGSLTAAHLVMKADDGTLIDATAMAKLITLLPASPDAVTIFGCISLWENPANNVQAAFQKLTAAYDKLAKYQQYAFGEGTYGAKVDGDDIEITY